MRVTKLNPFGGFSAETSAGLTIVGATILGIPVSTTHTITGSIIGVGAVKGLSAVRWGVAKNILWAWVLTIPFSAIFAMITYEIVTYLALCSANLDKFFKNILFIVHLRISKLILIVFFIISKKIFFILMLNEVSLNNKEYIFGYVCAMIS